MNRLFAVTLRLSEVASPQCQTAKEAPIPQEIVDKKNASNFAPFLKNKTNHKFFKYLQYWKIVAEVSTF